MDSEFLDFIIEEKSELEKLLKNKSCIVVFHNNDADGITSMYLFRYFLKRLNCISKFIGVETLTKDIIMKIIRSRIKNIIFLDIGSGYLDLISEMRFEKNIVIIDHHKPYPENYKAPGIHINPEEFNFSGDYYASTSSLVAYMLLDEIEKSKLDIAITGALGDLQDIKFGKLKFLNELIVKEAEKIGLIYKYFDLNTYYDSKDLISCIESLDDPFIPEISMNRKNIVNLLNELEIEYKIDNKLIRWRDLTLEDKKRIINYLALILIEYGDFDEIFRLAREHYFSRRLKEECRKIATIVNSMAKYNQIEDAIKFLEGRIDHKLLKKYISQHKRNIKINLEEAEKRKVVEDGIAILDLRDCCPHGIIGAITGLFLKSHKDIKIAIGIAKEDQNAKISIRCKDIDFDISKIIREAAIKCGGLGGGHKYAAGALIPMSNLSKFINEIKGMIKNESKNLSESQFS